MAFGAPIAEEFVRIRADTQGFKGEATSGIGSSMKSIVGGFAGVFAGVKIFDFVKNSVIGFNSTLEQSRAAFTNLLGGIAPANKMLADLQNFAKTTPFAFEQLIPVAQQLVGALGKSVDVTAVMTQLGDAVSATGGSADKLSQLTLAYTQLATSGTAHLGDLMQINNAVPGALARMAAAAGMSVGDFRTAVSKSMISSGKAVELFKKVTTDPKYGIAGGMAAQSKTFAGAMSNIGDALQQGLAAAGAPVFEFVSGVAKGFADFLSILQDTGSLGGSEMDQFFGQFGAGGTIMLGVLRGIVAGVGIMRQALVLGFHVIGSAFDLVSAHAAQIRSAFNVVVGAATAIFDVVNTHRELFGAIAAGIAIATVALFGIAAAMVVGTAVSTAFGAALAFAFSPITIIVVSIGLLVAAMIYLYRNNETARTIMQAAWHAIRTVITTTIDVIRLYITTFIAIATTIWHHWGSTITTVVNIAFNTIRGVIVGVMTVIRGIINVILGVIHGNWSQVWNGLGQIVSGAFGVIRSILAGAIGILGALAVSIGGAILRGIVSLVSQVPGKVSTLIKGIPGALGDLGSLLYAKGKQIIQGLIDGIKSMVGLVSNAVSSVASAITDHLPNSPAARVGPLADHPPEIMGARIVQALAEGMLARQDVVAHAVHSLASGIAGALGAPIPHAGAALTPVGGLGRGSALVGAGGAQITIHGGVTVHAPDAGGFADSLLTAAAEAARR